MWKLDWRKEKYLIFSVSADKGCCGESLLKTQQQCWITSLTVPIFFYLLYKRTYLREDRNSLVWKAPVCVIKVPVSIWLRKKKRNNILKRNVELNWTDLTEVCGEVFTKHSCSVVQWTLQRQHAQTLVCTLWAFPVCFHFQLTWCCVFSCSSSDSSTQYWRRPVIGSKARQSYKEINQCPCLIDDIINILGGQFATVPKAEKSK